MSIEFEHSSATAEHFTPVAIVEAARTLLGGIDLDPASCTAANRIVRADRIYTKTDDGLLSQWAGRIFLNPPGGKTNGKSNQKTWWFKLAREYADGRVTAAVFVCFSVELLQTTQVNTPTGLALPLDFPICFPSRRVAYTREDGTKGTSPPHSSCIIYLPPRDLSKAHDLWHLRLSFDWLGACR